MLNKNSALHRTFRRQLLKSVEKLEDRRLLALLGFGAPELPVVNSDFGDVSYNAGTNQFDVASFPLSFTSLSGTTNIGVTTASELETSLSLVLNNDGSFNSGVAGDDLVIRGRADIDADGTFDTDGILLTAEVVDFGFENGSGDVDFFDFRLTATGGALFDGGTLSSGGTYSNFFDLKDVGLVLNSENSTFNDSFTENFVGSPKSTLGPIAPEVNETLPVQLGDFVWKDENANGIQDPGEPGIPGVTVNLKDESGTIIATQQTDADGRYLFTVDANGGELDPGTYSVQFIAPAGYEFTLLNEGTDDTIDSDADETTNGMTATTTLESGEVDLTLDVGLFTTGIELIKYVDAIVDQEEMVMIDFDNLSAGDIVSNQYPGVTIYGKNARDPYAGNRAMVFDSANPTGYDYDLGSPNEEFGGPGIGSGGGSSSAGPNSTALGNVLIISEDGDSNDPDDEAHGGWIKFTFDHPVRIDAIDLLDIDSNESGGSVITLSTENGTSYVNVPALGNNSFQSIPVGAENVNELKVKFVGSGALAKLKYTKITQQKVWFDANDAPGVEFHLEDEIEFSYHVTNTGHVPLSPVVLVDDDATPGDNSDDFAPVYVSGDTDNDGALDVDEEWIYTATITADEVGQFTNTALVTGTPVNDSGTVVADNVTDDDPANYTVKNNKKKVKLTFDLQGHSKTYGHAGNIRTFDSGPVSVNASAFSRKTSTGAWSEAYLGSYSGGLGVTNNGEGYGDYGSHRLDNRGRHEYILFEFSQEVAIDRALLASVVDDSDVSIWIGNVPDAYNNHQTLSDAFLAGLDHQEDNLTNSQYTRWADLNDGEVYGNVLVIAAWTGDHTPEDQFKVKHLEICAHIEAPEDNTKFFVVDDMARRTFEYDADGGSVEDYAIGANLPFGVTADATGENVWVVDYYGEVYHYDNDGNLLANWDSMRGRLEGIATDGQHIWTVKDKRYNDRAGRVYFYQDGASASSSRYPTSYFNLHPYNTNPTGITTDGNLIWVVNEGNRAGGVGDKVYVYNTQGHYLGRWQLDNANRRPTGITIDPTGGSAIWIVDNGTKQVFEYSMGRDARSGGQYASKVFDLADGNHCPQGIADPPAARSKRGVSVDLAMLELLKPERDENPLNVEQPLVETPQELPASVVKFVEVHQQHWITDSSRKETPADGADSEATSLDDLKLDQQI